MNWTDFAKELQRQIEDLAKMRKKADKETVLILTTCITTLNAIQASILFGIDNE